MEQVKGRGGQRPVAALGPAKAGRWWRGGAGARLLWPGRGPGSAEPRGRGREAAGGRGSEAWRRERGVTSVPVASQLGEMGRGTHRFG